MRLSAKSLCIAVGIAMLVSAGCRATELEEDEDGEEAALGGCGSERWSIKTGTDVQASRLDLTHLTETDIGTLRALPAPGSLSSTNRISPTETTVFEIKNARLTFVKHESDGDYHLVIQDAAGETMIAEIPSPDCAEGSAWSGQITRARHDADAKLATAAGRAAYGLVSVVGGGFFDAMHGQTGVAPNGIEIHPVLGICFGQDCVVPAPSSLPAIDAGAGVRESDPEAGIIDSF